jgi:hypothetical protein
MNERKIQANAFGRRAAEANGSGPTNSIASKVVMKEE